MNNNKVIIKGSQFMFLVSGFVYGSFLLLSFLTSMAGHDMWLSLLTGYLVCIPLLICFSSLARMLPGKDLNQMLEYIYGRIFGKAISTFYFMYFLLLLSFNLYDVAIFYTSSIMTDTETIPLLIIFATLCAYSAAKGMAPVAKISLFVLIMGFFIASMTTLLSIKNMNLSSFLPIFDLSIGNFAKSTGIAVVVPFGEVVALLFVAPQVDRKNNLTRFLIGGLSIITALFLIISFRNIATLGPSSTIYAQSAYQSVRMINIGNFITRVELFVALAITVGFFIKNSVLYFTTAVCFTRLLELKSYKTVLLPLGATAVVIASISFRSSVNHAAWGEKYSFFFALPFNVFIPVLTLIIAKLRGKTGDGSAF